MVADRSKKRAQWVSKNRRNVALKTRKERVKNALARIGVLDRKYASRIFRGRVLVQFTIIIVDHQRSAPPIATGHCMNTPLR